MLRTLAALISFAAVGLVYAQDYPNRPIRLIVPFSPGGVTDTSARAITDRLATRLGQQIIIENRVGAGGNIGTEAVAKAAPDGYTLLLGFDGTLVINPNVYAKLPFDSITDFAPITKLGDATLIMVATPSLPVSNIAELVAYSKKSAGGVSYGTSGTGSTPHLAGELLKLRTGALLTHVPYKGGGQAIGDVVGGQLPLLYTAIATAQQYVKSNRVKALGISSLKRSSALPEVPTFAESGIVGFDVASWTGILAPAKTPRPIIERLHRELVATLATPEVRERYAVLGIEIAGNTPEQFAEQIKTDLARWAKVVKDANIKLE